MDERINSHLQTSELRQLPGNVDFFLSRSGVNGHVNQDTIYYR